MTALSRAAGAALLSVGMAWAAAPAMAASCSDFQLAADVNSFSDGGAGKQCEAFPTLSNDQPGDIAAVDPFGITAWSFLGKWNINDNGSLGLVEGDDSPGGPLSWFDIVGGNLAQAGEITVEQTAHELFPSMMITFKGPNSTEDTVVGFVIVDKVDPGDDLVSYISPFPPKNAGDPQDVSHFSIWGSNQSFGREVPLPAALPALVAGLGLLGWRARARA